MAAQEGPAGLNFADEGEAAAFEALVQERLRRRQQRAGESTPPTMHRGCPPPRCPPLTPSPLSPPEKRQLPPPPPPGDGESPRGFWGVGVTGMWDRAGGTEGDIGCGADTPCPPCRAPREPDPDSNIRH